MWISPLSRSKLYDSRCLAGLETSSDGQVAPSTRRNSGSVVSAAKRSCRCWALTVYPSCGSTVVMMPPHLVVST